MSWVWKPVPNGRSYSRNVNETRYTVAYTAYQQPIATATEIDFEAAANAFGLSRGSTHPNVRNAWLVDLNGSTDIGTVWNAVATYSTNPGIAVINNEDDPTIEPARISWDGENFQQVAFTDKNNNLIVNSAGDPYDPPLMKDFSRPTCSVRKYMTSVPAAILTYPDRINSDTFIVDGLSVAPGKAKCKRISVSEMQTRNGIQFREVTIVLHFAADGWTRKVLDAGLRYKYFSTPDATYKRAPIVDKDEQGVQTYVTAPVPLDGNGVKLDDPSPSSCVYRSYDLDEALPFAVLPLY